MEADRCLADLVDAERAMRDARASMYSAMIRLLKRGDWSDPCAHAPNEWSQMYDTMGRFEKALTREADDMWYGACVWPGGGRYAGMERQVLANARNAREET